MTTVAPEIAPGTPAPSPTWEKLDAWLDTASDWLNPLLVKEARQSLKSWQFVITFFLTLLASWLWSVMAVLFFPGREWETGGAGRMLLAGYVWILAFPLIVIVPFTAFRSLAVEREDGTFELLSVSTLTPEQIVFGKLSAALLQLGIYLSALAPCIAFTYLLRGIDVISIIFIVVVMVAESTFLAALCLLLATTTKVRLWQTLLSVAMIIGLLFAFGGTGGALFDLLDRNRRINWNEPGLIPVIGGFALFHITTVALMLVASASRLTFAADNYSTRLRLLMMLQAACYFGWICWMAWGMGGNGPDFRAIPLVGAICGGLYWFLMGIFLNAEGDELSPRARRELPRTLLGRLLLAWCQPGPSTGYVFAVLNGAILIAACVGLGTNMIAQMPMPPGFGPWELFFSMTFFCVAYLAFYLGVGRLAMIGIQRLMSASSGGYEVHVQGAPLISLLVHLAILAFGTLGPLILQAFFGVHQYTVLQATNPFWTLAALLSRGTFNDAIAAILPVGAAAISLFVVNLVIAAPSIVAPREATPERVKTDDAALGRPANTSGL